MPSFQRWGLAQRENGCVSPTVLCVERKSHAQRNICKDFYKAEAGLQHHESTFGIQIRYFIFWVFFFLHWFKTHSTMLALSAAFLLLVAYMCELIFMEWYTHLAEWEPYVCTCQLNIEMTEYFAQPFFFFSIFTADFSVYCHKINFCWFFKQAISQWD